MADPANGFFDRVPTACWLGVCVCPASCDCVGLGCDHPGTRLSWAHPKGGANRERGA